MVKEVVCVKLKVKSYVCKVEGKFEKNKIKSSEDVECSNKKKRKSYRKLNY